MEDKEKTSEKVDHKSEHKKWGQELEEFFKLSPDIMCICTTEGKFVKVNISCETVLGYKADEILELGWPGLVHPDDMAHTNKEVENQLKGSSVVNFINRFRCKDGTYKTLEWQATPSNNGIVYATARDITDRKKAEEELKKKMEDLEQFHKLSVGRELKMIEMKKQVNALSKELGRPEPYA